MSDNKQNIAIVGATSHLAQACARKLAELGHSMVLVGRNNEKLELVRDDLVARGAQVSIELSDLDNLESHEELVARVQHADSFWFFAGSLPDQSACESDWELTRQAIVTNGLSVISLLTRLANTSQARGSGSFVVISSVAGDRGRSSNYVYGAAKSAVTAFCEGLRGRLHKVGINVLVVKPGFFISPMTESVEKKPAVLWVEADHVAKDVVSAWQNGKETIYSPWFWRPIMRLIREIPTQIFKKLSI